MNLPRKVPLLKISAQFTRNSHDVQHLLIVKEQKFTPEPVSQYARASTDEARAKPAQITFLQMIIDPASSICFEAEPEKKNLVQCPPRQANESMFGGKLLASSLLKRAVAFAVAAAIYGHCQKGQTKTPCARWCSSKWWRAMSRSYSVAARWVQLGLTHLGKVRGRRKSGFMVDRAG
jgi:hypothetical protein